MKALYEAINHGDELALARVAEYKTLLEKVSREIEELNDHACLMNRIVTGASGVVWWISRERQDIEQIEREAQE